MLFTEGLTTMITSIIGAGVFALPTFARELGFLSLLFILLGFVFSLVMGYLIVSFTPGSVDDEVERLFGKKLAWAPLFLDIIISLLALTAYIVGIQAHLGANPIILLFFMFIPLMFRLYFPPSFSIGLAGVTIFYLFLLSFLNLGKITTFPATTFNFGASAFLLAATYFAFFGHNIIPRIRAIVQRASETWKVLLISFSVVLSIYLVFVITTIPMGSADLSTVMLAFIHEGNSSVVLTLIASIIFYTSFIIIGLHLQDRIGRSMNFSLPVVVSVSSLYALTYLFQIPFSNIIASAGFVVSCYGALVGVTAFKHAKKEIPYFWLLPSVLITLSLLPWILLIFSLLF